MKAVSTERGKSELVTTPRKRVWRDITKGHSKRNKITTKPQRKLKLKIKCLNFTRTRVGEKNALPNEAVLSFQFVGDVSGEKNVYEMPISAVKIAKDNLLLMPLNKTLNKFDKDIFLEVSLTFKPEGDSNEVKFFWKLNFNLDDNSDSSSGITSAEMLPNLSVTLYAALENKVDDDMAISATTISSKTDIVSVVNERLIPKNPQALASLRLNFSWKRNRLQADKIVEDKFERTFWMKTSFNKLPVIYVFRLSAFDDVQLEKYSFDCVWCKWKASDAFNLYAHYKLAHQNFIFDVSRQINGYKFEVKRKIIPQSNGKAIGAKKSKSALKMSDKIDGGKEFLFVRKKQRVIKGFEAPSEGIEFCPEIQVYEDCDKEVDPLEPSTISKRYLRELVLAGKPKRTVDDYYTGRTCTKILTPIQEYEDSDDEDYHVDWQHELGARQISEFLDVSDPEKTFISLWNKHRLRYVHINGDAEMLNLLMSFIYLYHKILTEQKLVVHFIMHLVNIFDHGVLSKEEFRKVVCFSQMYNFCPSVVENLIPKI